MPETLRRKWSKTHNKKVKLKTILQDRDAEDDDVECELVHTGRPIATYEIWLIIYECLIQDNADIGAEQMCRSLRNAEGKTTER